jgi:nitrite reductase/ring-hydroxylating ferredoxin subunit
MAFVAAAKVSDVPAGAIKDIRVGEAEVALANVGGKFYAISNTCLHRGGPLGQGVLEGSIVTCPWHGWQFDVTTGKVAQNQSVGVSCYATEVRGDEVCVNLESPCS